MLCGLAGIARKTIENSAAYIKDWLSVLRDDTLMLFRAAKAAQVACEFIQGRVKPMAAKKRSAQPEPQSKPTPNETEAGQLSLLRRPPVHTELIAA